MTNTDTPSVYRINPAVMVQGSELKKRGLLITYSEDQQSALPEDGGFPALDAGAFND